MLAVGVRETGGKTQQMSPQVVIPGNLQFYFTSPQMWGAEDCDWVS